MSDFHISRIMVWAQKQLIVVLMHFFAFIGEKLFCPSQIQDKFFFYIKAECVHVYMQVQYALNKVGIYCTFTPQQFQFQLGEARGARET